MYQITLSLPDETALALHLTPEQLAQEISLLAAIKLYELGKLSGVVRSEYERCNAILAIKAIWVPVLIRIIFQFDNANFPLALLPT